MPELSILETTAAIFGVLSVLLARYAHIGVFPTGLISTLLYIYICFGAGLYADMGVNAWYATMSVYGWWRWLRPPLPTLTPDLQVVADACMDAYNYLSAFALRSAP